MYYLLRVFCFKSLCLSALVTVIATRYDRQMSQWLMLNATSRYLHFPTKRSRLQQQAFELNHND